MKKEEFLTLLNRYLSGDTNREENKQMLHFYESFQTSDEWDESLGSKEEIQNKMLHRIQTAIKSEGTKVIPLRPFYSRTSFKVVAAASIAMLISISLLFNTEKKSKQNIPVVANKNILIGSDKATLTLEDGSVIELKKGESYNQGNATSNGEKLIYNSKNNKQAAIANNFLTIPRGGQFFVQLADSTKVWLNSESQLKYPIAFVDGEIRQVELVYGEAYFEVSPSTKHKGSKFKVKTAMQNVEVIGTEFNIKAYKDETAIYTTLVEGKVAVSNASNKEILAPNEQSRISKSDDRIAISEVDVYNEISWRKGLFVFKGMPLKDIARVLSRWYDVDVEFADPALGNVRFNGVLNKNQKLEDILTTIKNINFINAYEKKDNKIIIK